MGIAMQHFRGRLRDGDRIIIEQLTGYLEDEGGPATDSGRLEVHEGGILGSHLPGDRPYRLELEDGRAVAIDLTKVHASNSSGIAYVEFRLAGELVAGAA